MKTETLTELTDRLIEEYKDKVVADTVRLINIKSVKSEPLTGAPFGDGARKVLCEVMRMGKEDGFYCRDYGVGVISVSLYEGEPDVGIWLHGDVVPEGDGWNFEPFNATVHNGCVIGRGSADNKGQLAALYNLFRIFRDADIKLSVNPAIFVGSNEETGMKDIIGISGNDDAKGFINVFTPPALSLVPDEDFPVCIGGKGGMNFKLRSKEKLCGMSFSAGAQETPGTAFAYFKKDTQIPDTIPECTIKHGDITEISAETPPVHTSCPQKSGNMITKLTGALLESSIDICDSDRKILEFLHKISLDINGTVLGIDTEHEVLGKLTMTPVRVECENGYITVSFNSRYPLGITFEEATERIRINAEKQGFELLESIKGVTPYLLDENTNIVKYLCDTANSVTGENGKPFTMSGGTYANRLPNAYVYGAGLNVPPSDFESGFGHCHGRDEAANIDRMKRLMRVYAKTLMGLDKNRI